MNKATLIPLHGGFRKLKSFQVAQLAYDVTVRFCDRYIEKRSRNHDQTVQAARSGVANAVLSHLHLSCYLLDRPIAAQAAAFEKEGGFTERLCRVRAPGRNRPTVPRFHALLALLCVGLGTIGCSSFHRDWKAAAQSAPPRTLEGRWEGTWHSDVNDHKNQLRCLLTRQTNGVFSARFHAKYRKVFPWSFSYTVPLMVRQREDVFLFEGEADLGWYAGGHYDYMGHASATNFFSTYRCNYDHGTFQMTRPSAELGQ